MAMTMNAETWLRRVVLFAHFITKISEVKYILSDRLTKFYVSIVIL